MRNLLLKLITVFLLLTIYACAARTKIINGPDGTPHHLVSCSSVEYCYEKATETCGGTYQIVNSSNEVSGDVKFSSSTTNLLIKCKN